MKTYSIIASSTARHPEILQFYTLQYYFPDYTCQSIYITHGKDEALLYTKEALKDSDFLVVFGGDGTFHEVASQVKNTSQPILYIPGGTNNDMAYNVSYHGDLQSYIKEAFHEEPYRFDIFKLDQKPFGYVAARGVFTDVPFTTSLQGKLEKGRKAYVKEMIHRFQKDKLQSIPIRMMIDGVFIDDDALACFFSNTKSIGGYGMKNASFDDGKMEVTIIQKKQKLKMLSELLKLAQAKKAWNELDFVKTYQASSVTVDFPTKEDFWCLDGDAHFTENQTSFDITLSHQVSLMHAKVRK